MHVLKQLMIYFSDDGKIIENETCTDRPRGSVAKVRTGGPRRKRQRVAKMSTSKPANHRSLGQWHRGKDEAGGGPSRG